MSKKRFKHPPLIEALIEVRWDLKESTPAGKRDPHYQFLLGLFRNKIQSEYPFHEELPASKIPDEMTGYVVKHRFRVAKDDWPLVQIGPGIMTVNVTIKYDTFESFKPKAVYIVKSLFECYPEKEALNIIKLALRYINAHEFDYSEQKVQKFISEKMHMQSEIPDFFFANGKVEEIPISYSLRTSLRCNEPPGIVSFSVDTGHKLKKRAVIWNHICESEETDIPDMPDNFEEWLQKAHDVIHIGFDGITKDYLEQEFDR